jgi:uncharacterized protein (DUF2237 family)
MSNTVVVDTDVVSYLFKSHSTAFQYLPDLTDRTPMISFRTLAELDRWVLEARWGEARESACANIWSALSCCRTTAICVQEGQR